MPSLSIGDSIPFHIKSLNGYRYPARSSRKSQTNTPSSGGTTDNFCVKGTASVLRSLQMKGHALTELLIVGRSRILYGGFADERALVPFAAEFCIQQLLDIGANSN